MGEIDNKKQITTEFPACGYMLEPIEGSKFNFVKHKYTHRITIYFRVFTIKYTEYGFTANYQNRWVKFLKSMFFRHLVDRALMMHPGKSKEFGLSSQRSYEKLETFTTNPKPFSAGLVNPR